MHRRLVFVFALDGQTLGLAVKIHADLAFILPQPERLIDDQSQKENGKQDADDGGLRKRMSDGRNLLEPETKCSDE